MNVLQFFQRTTLTVEPGKTTLFEVEKGIELWFSMNLRSPADVTLTSGGVTFGDSLCFSDSSQYWPMANNGFHTVTHSDIPKTGGPPSNTVVSFFGQTSMGRLGVYNHTDGVIQVTLISVLRRFSTSEG